MGFNNKQPRHWTATVSWAWLKLPSLSRRPFLVRGRQQVLFSLSINFVLGHHLSETASFVEDGRRWKCQANPATEIRSGRALQSLGARILHQCKVGGAAVVFPKRNQAASVFHRKRVTSLEAALRAFGEYKGPEFEMFHSALQKARQSATERPLTARLRGMPNSSSGVANAWQI